MPRISKVLVANRGEIAVRIMRTCRSMGIATVAVYSDADRGALHVRMADEAVHIGPSPSSESYLVIDKILDAARRTGADAVHPGFGFLSEREAFAEACAREGLIFIGPSPAAIRAMGLKREAKATAMAAGVPVVPGYNGEEQDPRFLAEKCREIGLPVLIKASAGGGGKGMRVCRALEDIESAIDSARREALNAFGDDTLIIERYIENPRHVEIQILGDQHGNLVHLFERECSIQRRHQKIIEESPSTALTPELREKMGNAALAVARAIGYYNAGTVEFIVGSGGEFYFLEVNTRLQVEHPVTECITGLDLVREQIRIAEGEPLGYTQADVRLEGAAVECRLYAEEPAQGFLPQSGRLIDWQVPEGLSWLRVDSGVEAGSEISTYYDPMIAKVITKGRTRREATQRMIYALENLHVHGLANNREFLLRTLRHPEYEAGRIHTHFIEQHFGDKVASDHDATLCAAASVAAALHAHALRQKSASLPYVRPGFRNNRYQDQEVAFLVGGERITVRYRALTHGAFHVSVGEQVGECLLVASDERSIALELFGHRRRFRVVRDGARVFVQVNGMSVTLHEEPRFPELERKKPAGGLTAPMPGKIVRVDVEEGQAVEVGQRLVLMEAMKMEHGISASEAGIVEAVLVRAGQQVEADQVLVVIKAATTA